MEKYINKLELVGFLRIQRDLATELNQPRMADSYQYILNKIEQGEFTEITGEEPKYPDG